MASSAKQVPLSKVRNAPSIDQVGVEERAARFQTRSLKGETKFDGLKLALSMLDLTTLSADDTPGKVKQLCTKAKNPSLEHPEWGRVAAVCVYPNMVATAAKELKGTGIHLASVATAFPAGMTRWRERLSEVKWAVDQGADEIDMVISRGAFLRGEYRRVYDEIATTKEACGKAHLKVILETGELQTYDNVRLASDIAMAAGGDFIKTSTGKISPAATLPVTLVMLEAIRDFQENHGIKIGMKPAGGISNSKLALQYLIMVKETLGTGWLAPDWFRFGASTLANDLLMQLTKQTTGQYQSADYFTND